MQRDQVRDLLTILKVNYPQSYKGWDAEQSKMYLELWCNAFKDVPAELVVKAVEAIINTDTRDFAPNVGQVKEMMISLFNPSISEFEAWTLVKKACRNGIYGAEEEFEKLPPLVQKLVGDPEQIRCWAVMDSDTLNTVVASNFQRSYKARAVEEKQIQMLPSHIKTAIGVTQNLMLEEKK